jgi:RHS repeat-associated protein
MGWSIGVPDVARRTSQGLPRYDDAKDVFVLSGAEDLVQVASAPGETSFVPRTEGLFAQIRHLCAANNDHWVVEGKDGLTSIYGTPGMRGADPAVVADPRDRLRIQAWRLTDTRDSFGNHISYGYVRDLAADGDRHWDQLYLSTIRYADFEENGTAKHLVSVELEYEDRPDPISDRRSGFEIRTRKRCKRLLVRTHAGADRLLRSYELRYADDRPEEANCAPPNRASLLVGVTVSGHDGPATQALPPLRLSYTRFDPSRRDLRALHGEDLPASGLASPEIELVDMFGNGLPDLLEMNGVARVWRNRGGRFDLPRPLHSAPTGLSLGAPGVQLLDADGDGRSDLMVTSGPLSGHFPMRFGAEWDPGSFRRHRLAPSFDLKGPEVKLLDLDGDGVTDALRAGTRLECFFSDRHAGWSRTRVVERGKLPMASFSDPRLRWADMSGDGLLDCVMLYGRLVEYTPNLGHGDWQAPVRMRAVPELPLDTDPRRLLLGDLDGDGLADLVLVEDGRITIWLNIAGEAWSPPVRIDGTPPVTDMAEVRLADVLGTGVQGVLWSRPAMTGARNRFFFLDPIGGKKPYLLSTIDNRIGAVTTISYAPSTHFFLLDEARPSTRWRTPLPFPVHVVEGVEVEDRLSGGRLTTEYHYRHGYWDGEEREFRGFGLVEQRDTESFESAASATDAIASLLAREHVSPPTLTRTWFHQGAVEDGVGGWTESDHSEEYWSGDPPMLGHGKGIARFLRSLGQGEPARPEAARDRRDALRALRGRILRTEVYALDGAAWDDRPYTVTEHAHELREEMPPAEGEIRRRVFLPFEIASRTTQWERGDDPMTRLAFSPQRDAFGQVLREEAIACPRGWRNLGDRPAEPFLATIAETRYAEPVPGRHMRDRVALRTTWEVTGTAGKTVAELRLDAASGIGLAVVAHEVNFYDGPAFVGLPFGQAGEHGAQTRTETLVATEAQFKEAYGVHCPPWIAAGGQAAWPNGYPQAFRAALPPGAGNVLRNAAPFLPGWYVASDRREHDFQAGLPPLGLLVARRDPLGHDTRITHEMPWAVLVKTVTDPAGLVTSVENDPRLLQPRRITDANGQATEVAFTPLGLVAAVFARGRDGEGDGANPSIRMEYNLDAFARSTPEAPQPISVRTIRRIHHDGDAQASAAERAETLERVEYSDGFGRVLQTREQAEDALFGDTLFGHGLIPPQPGQAPGDIVGRQRAPGDPPNVVVSGWRVHDNKGRVVQAFEPFFSTGWDYRTPAAEAKARGRDTAGMRVTTFYDPRGQAVRVVQPDGSETRVVFGIPGATGVPDFASPDSFTPTPWESWSYDANDNAGRAPAGGTAPTHHHDTPSSIVLDPLGRVVEAVARNRASVGDPIETHRTRSRYDIRGNLIELVDQLGRTAFRYAYDLANRRLRVDSQDAGLRLTAHDAAGRPIEGRDAKGAWTLHAHDALGRPTRTWARDGAGAALALRESLEYGDGGDPAQPPVMRAQQQAANRLGRLHRHFDEAGLLTIERYDFKGGIAEKSRRVLSDAQMLTGAPVDWEPPPATTQEAHVAALLAPEDYVTSQRQDALGRLARLTYPRDVTGARKELRPRHNRAGGLEAMELDGQPIVARIAYDARGQRSVVAYGNGLVTVLTHDRATSRLTRAWTGACAELGGGALGWRPQAPAAPQLDLGYTYDLVGNILRIADRTPGCGTLNGPAPARDMLDRRFDYDALYRLRRATGREDSAIPVPRPWDDAPRIGYGSGQHGTPDQDNAPNLTRFYVESYRYDPAGNLLALRHESGGAAWVRRFGMGGLAPDAWEAAIAPHLEGRAWPAAPGNRLTHVADGAALPAVTHRYDANGNLEEETGSRRFGWNWSDRLVSFREQAGAGPASLQAFYLYDAAGMRAKKLVRRQDGSLAVTVYVDGLFEHHMRVSPGGARRENNTLHVMDDASRVARIRVGQGFADQGRGFGQDASPALVYELADHLGSTTLSLDEAGAWVNREEFTPYGETSFGGYARKRYQFAGMERDEESGLALHGARHYAPHLGRWTSCDPAGAMDGHNLYAFVRGNPIGLADPTGTAADDAPGLKRSNDQAAANLPTGVTQSIGLSSSPAASSDSSQQAAPSARPPPPPASKPPTPSPGILSSLFPSHMSGATRPPLSPALSAHQGWQAWHAEATQQAISGAAHANLVRTAALSIIAGGAAAGPALAEVVPAAAQSLALPPGALAAKGGLASLAAATYVTLGETSFWLTNVAVGGGATIGVASPARRVMEAGIPGAPIYGAAAARLSSNPAVVQTLAEPLRLSSNFLFAAVRNPRLAPAVYGKAWERLCIQATPNVEKVLGGARQADAIVRLAGQSVKADWTTFAQLEAHAARPTYQIGPWVFFLGGGMPSGWLK